MNHPSRQEAEPADEDRQQPKTIRKAPVFIISGRRLLLFSKPEHPGTRLLTMCRTLGGTVNITPRRVRTGSSRSTSSGPMSVRYVAQDDERQSALASQVFEGLTESDQGYLNTVTMVETYWVLRRTYKIKQEAAAQVVQGLLESREIAVENPDTLRRALRRVSHGAELPDASS